MFGKKLYKLDVTEGIDIGLDHWFQGERFTVGADSSDDLVLSEPGVIEAHITFVRDKTRWRFEVNPSAEVRQSGTLVTGGPVKSGLTLALATGTVLRIAQKPVPAELKQALANEREDEAMSFPVAVGLLTLLACAMILLIVLSQPAPPPEKSPIGREDRVALLKASFAECVHNLSPSLPTEAARRLDPTELFWRAGHLSQDSDQAGAEAHAGRLFEILEQTLIRASLLEQDDDFKAARDEFRRIETLLPNQATSGACPIVEQARRDISNLTTRLPER